MTESSATDSPVIVRRWSELTRDELYQIVKLRTDVFFVEQKCDDIELDNRDQEPTTIHAWIEDERGCAAYVRQLWNPEPEYLDAHVVLGRVVTRADRRGEGLSRQILDRLVSGFDGAASMLHAQSYVVGLYAKLGYEAFGDEYDEAGIAHRSMYRAGAGANDP